MDPEQTTQNEQSVTESAATPEQEHATPNEQSNTAMAVVAYILFFIPLLTDAKDDPFVKFHVKQGFVLFLAGAVAHILSIPLMFIGWILYLGVLVLAVLGIMNAIHHKEEPLPLIGQFAEKFHF
jgi:uncharacterized membrane protein